MTDAMSVPGRDCYLTCPWSYNWGWRHVLQWSLLKPRSIRDHGSARPNDYHNFRWWRQFRPLSQMTPGQTMSGYTFFRITVDNSIVVMTGDARSLCDREWRMLDPSTIMSYLFCDDEDNGSFYVKRQWRKALTTANIRSVRDHFHS